MDEKKILLKSEILKRCSCIHMDVRIEEGSFL